MADHLGPAPHRGGFVIDALLCKGRDLLWAITASDILRRLTHHWQWPVRRFEQWLGDTFCEQLLPSAPPHP